MADSEEASNNDSMDLPDSPDIATIISYLLNSGQMRLLRSGGFGGFEPRVHILGLDNNEEDETPTHFQSPRGDLNPDTTNIDESQVKDILLNSNGWYHKHPKNLTLRILKREQGCLCKKKFSNADFIICNKHFLPNSCDIVERYRAKAFCGTFSNDGTVFMSGSQDEHIRLYHTSNGRFKMFRDIEAKDMGYSIADTAYSPDQMYIIYSSWSHYIHLCNIYGEHGTHLPLDLKPLRSRFCAFSISFSPDSKEIVAGGNDNCLYIYDRGSNRRTVRVDSHNDDVNSVKFVGDSANILISGSDDGLCKIWDRRILREENPDPVGCFAGHTGGITYVSPKDDGVCFLSNSKDQSIKLWDSRRFSSQKTIDEALSVVANQTWDYRWSEMPRRSQRLNNSIGNDAVMTYRGHVVTQTLIRSRFSPQFSTGQQFIYTGCGTGNIVIYDVLSGEIVRKLEGGHRKCVRDVSWHPHLNIIMSTSWDSTIGKWEFKRKLEEGDKLISRTKKRRGEVASTSSHPTSQKERSYLYTGVIFITFMVAFVLAVCIELPVRNLREFFSRRWQCCIPNIYRISRNIKER